MLKRVLFFIGIALVFSMPLRAMAEEEKVLNIYTWAEYLPQKCLDNFTKETGIKVVYTTYDSNEAMFAKLKLLGAKGYDIVLPSTYYIEPMRNEGMLAKLDKSKLSNIKNLKSDLVDLSFDKGNEYSVPYQWGVAGMLVNKKYIDVKTITSWNDLWRPEFKGHILMPDDLRDTFSIALLALGKATNTTKEEEIKAAYEYLVKLRPMVRVFASTNAMQPMASEEAYIGAVWNGDAYLAMQENENLAYIYPKEGSSVWIDSFVIPAKAEHPDNAYKFIDFMLRPDNALIVLEELKYSTPNAVTQKEMPEKYRESHVISPTKEDLQHSEITEYLGKTTSLYEKYWELLKTNTKEKP